VNHYPPVPVARRSEEAKCCRALAPSSCTFSARLVRVSPPVAGANKRPTPTPIPTPAANRRTFQTARWSSFVRKASDVLVTWSAVAWKVSCATSRRPSTWSPIRSRTPFRHAPIGQKTSPECRLKELLRVHNFPPSIAQITYAAVGHHLGCGPSSAYQVKHKGYDS
jgi:hypothetical protein